MNERAPMGRVLDADAPDTLSTAAACLLAGGVVGLPTETVYGLAACAHLPEAVGRVFSAKGRPAHDPLIVHVLPDWAALLDSGLVDTSANLQLVQALAAAYWPGPLTLLVPRGASLDPAITAGQPLVALRAPAHPVFQRVLEHVGAPLVAPSANRFGHVSPTTAAHVLADLGPRIDLVVDGGPCTIGLESTVVLPDGDTLHVLRQGAVTLDDLRTRMQRTVVEGTRVLERPLAPGQLARHYATSTPLRLCSAAALQPAANAALLVLAGPPPEVASGYGRAVTLAPDGDLRKASRDLYAVLRQLDQADLARIDVLGCSEVGLGAALMDRLRRAATP